MHKTPELHKMAGKTAWIATGGEMQPTTDGTSLGCDRGGLNWGIPTRVGQ